MATTMHWSPNFSAASATKSGIFYRRGVDGNLVGAGKQQPADVGHGADAAAHRERHEALLGSPGDDVEDRVAIIGRGSNVEEAELVRTGSIVGLRRLDRIARVDQVDEIDALDDSTVLDVEAGYDAVLERHPAASSPRRMRSASAGSIRPS